MGQAGLAILVQLSLDPPALGRGLVRRDLMVLRMLSAAVPVGDVPAAGHENAGAVGALPRPS